MNRQALTLLLLLGLHSSSQPASSSSSQAQFESQLIHRETQLTMAAPLLRFYRFSIMYTTGLKGHGEAVSSTTHEVAVPAQAKVSAAVHSD